MKEKKIDAVEVWKEVQALAVRLGLTVIDRTVYLHLLRLTRMEGKRRLRFSILGIAPRLGLSGAPVREAVRRLMDKGVLRLIERSNIGHLVEVLLPSEVRGPRASRTEDGGSKLRPGTNLEEVDFLRTRELRLAIHEREGGKCAFIACGKRPAGATAWITWCPRWRAGAIRTATWFPAVWTATGKRGLRRREIFCAGCTARGACRRRTSAHACVPCRRWRQASCGHRFSARRMQKTREAKKDVLRRRFFRRCATS
jgi:predicted DNA-binding transcriptional regulator